MAQKTPHSRGLRAAMLGPVLTAALTSVAAAQGFLGLYEGQLLIPDGPEPFTLRFDPGRRMTAISELETVERETPGVGIWEAAPGSGVSFGYISYREGSGWLCTEFNAAAPPASCTLVVTGRASVEPRSGAMTGSIVLTVKDRSDGNDAYTVGPIPYNAARKSVKDLIAYHDQ